jgi:hypothetical protein
MVTGLVGWSTNWGSGSLSSTVTVNSFHNGYSPPTVRLRFTQSAIPSQGGYLFFTGATGPPDWEIGDLEIKDSHLYGGYLYLSDSANAIEGFTNNILEEIYLDVEGAAKAYFYNNLLREVQGWFWQTDTNNTWIFHDNLLDASPLYNYADNLSHENNAYYQSSEFYSLYDTNGSEMILTNLLYETGPQGPWYQPNTSPLIDMGSRFATNAALYHYTVTTNQTKEGTSVVDIGFHYVALTNGVPIDSDEDGLPDYLEDPNGNGLFDSGETCFHDPILTLARDGFSWPWFFWPSGRAGGMLDGKRSRSLTCGDAA